MEMTLSMFATTADYWKYRAELTEKTVEETAAVLGVEPDNELMLKAVEALRKDAERGNALCEAVSRITDFLPGNGDVADMAAAKLRAAMREYDNTDTTLPADGAG